MTINLGNKTTRIQKQFPLSVFVSTDSLVAGGYAISRQNNLELHLGCHTYWSGRVGHGPMGIMGKNQKRLICIGSSLYLQWSYPSDYIRHIHHPFIIIFETRHTGHIMASLNVLVKLLPSSPYGVHLRTKIIENKTQFEVQKLDYPCRNLVI